MVGGADGRLRLPRAVAEMVLAHARAELPNEACGLLSGSAADGLVSTYHPARNEEASPLRYTVHPEDLVRITFAIDDAGEDLVAIFHSHTHTPAVPSPTDLREATYPDAFYLLATLSEGGAALDAALRAWRIRDGASTEVGLELA